MKISPHIGVRKSSRNSHAITFTYLSQEDLLHAGCLDIHMAIEAAEAAMLARRRGEVMLPEKIVQIFNQETQERINCLPATLRSERVCGTKWVSVFPRNVDRYGLQNLTALFILSEIEKGFPLAVLEGTMASNLRTGAMGAIAAKHLAPSFPRVIGFIGSGEQAKMHLLALKTVCPTLAECRFAAKTIQGEQTFLRQMSAILPDMKFVAGNTNLEIAARDADILVTATSAQAPLLRAAWMKPGTFYSHIGGWEDEYAVAQQCDKIVCDDWESGKHRTQTLSRMYKDGLLQDSDIYANLDELVAGEKMGRMNTHERVYFNAVGMAHVDIAVACAMYQRATQKGFGQELTMQETTIFEHPQIARFLLYDNSEQPTGRKDRLVTSCGPRGKRVISC